MVGVVTATLVVLVCVPVLLHYTSGFYPQWYYFLALPIGSVLFLMAEKTGVKSIWEQIGGLLSGLPWRAVVIGPVCLIRDEVGLSLRVGRRWLSHSGTYLYCPINESNDEILAREQRLTRIQAFVTVVGASLVIALLLTFVIATSRITPVTDIVGVVLGLLIADVAALAVTPRWRRTWLVDPADVTTQRHLAIARLSLHLLSGVRPRDLDVRLLETTSRPLDQSSEAIIGLLMRYRHALDSGAIEEAGRCLDEMVVRCTPYHAEIHWAVYGEAAFYSSYIRGDAETAKIWIGKHASPSPEAHTEARIRSAVLLAAGQVYEAGALAKQGLRSLQPTLMPGLAELDEDFLLAIAGAADDQAAAQLARAGR